MKKKQLIGLTLMGIFLLYGHVFAGQSLRVEKQETLLGVNTVSGDSDSPMQRCMKECMEERGSDKLEFCAQACTIAESTNPDRFRNDYKK